MCAPGRVPGRSEFNKGTISLRQQYRIGILYLIDTIDGGYLLVNLVGCGNYQAGCLPEDSDEIATEVETLEEPVGDSTE